jgi:hypothetical protein
MTTRRTETTVDNDSPQAAGPAALARTAAEAVRSLNHLTLGAGGLEQPAGACEVLGELSLAASGFGQLLGQVSRWLTSALAGGRLGCDDGTDPAAPVSGAWVFLSRARSSAAALAEDLSRAQQQLALVNGKPSRKEARS